MMKAPSVLQVDPALFTGPYDAALTAGLVAAGVSVRWASRAPRPGEETELSSNLVEPVFYRGSLASVRSAGVAAKLRKGISHLSSSRLLPGLCERLAIDVVHYQWAVLPVIDLMTMRRLRRRRPVVLTVHDSKPFNGIPTSRLQVFGYGSMLRSVDHLVVHTPHGRDVLVEGGCDPRRVSVIPHGPLSVGRVPPPASPDGRPWTFVLFGKLQNYKGVDVLVEAVAALGDDTRDRLRVIIAGEALMDLAPLRRRIDEADLAALVEIRPGRLDEAEMRALFTIADAFVFPYLQIEASGVYNLVRSFGRWIIASDLGSFRNEVFPEAGELVPAGDALALASALLRGIGRRPSCPPICDLSWSDIGGRLRDLYVTLLMERERNN